MPSESLKLIGRVERREFSVSLADLNLIHISMGVSGGVHVE